jgi:hypothetical protein
LLEIGDRVSSASPRPELPLRNDLAPHLSLVDPEHSDDS